MKNLNYYSQNRGSLAALQSNDVGYDCRSTVVRPSFDCRSTLLKLVTVLVLVLTVGVGNVWGTTETITLSDFGWSNASTQSSITATSATIALAKNSGSTAPTYYTSDGLRIYGVASKTTGGTISFTPKTGITISSIAFTHTAQNSGVLAIKSGGGSYSSKTWSGTLAAGSTLTLVATNSGTKAPQVRMTVITITYTAAAADPALSVSKASITSGLTYVSGGGPSAAQTFTVSGTDLTADVGVSAPTNFEVSLDGSSYAASKTITASGTLGATTVYVRLKSGLAVNSYSGNITVSSTGATSKTVSLSGSVTAPVPTLTATPTSLSWGTVNKGAGLTTKTFTISGSNLTGNLSVATSGSYTVDCGNSITVTSGSPTVTTITVTAPSTATAGTKNGTITISGGGLASNVTVSCGLVVNEIDQFIDEVQSTSGYTSASPHIEAGSYGTTPKLTDKATATSGTCEQQHYHFVGWITSAKYEAGTSIAVGDLQTPTTATGATYYAVWAKQAAGGGGFDGETGGTFKIYAIDDDDHKNYMTNTVNSNKITSTTTEANAQEYTLTAVDDNGTTKFTISYVSGGTTYYVYHDGGNNTNISIGTTASNWQIVAGTNGTWRVKSGYSTRSLIYRTTNVFAAYANSNATGTSTEYYDLEIDGGVSYEDYIAKCCTSLGQINGSVFWTTLLSP